MADSKYIHTSDEERARKWLSANIGHGAQEHHIISLTMEFMAVRDEEKRNAETAINSIFSTDEDE
jgi:hypothetical protein